MNEKGNLFFFFGYQPLAYIQTHPLSLRLHVYKFLTNVLSGSKPLVDCLYLGKCNYTLKVRQQITLCLLSLVAVFVFVILI